VTGGIYENKSGFHEMPQQAKIAEDKKFWQQASLTTKAGRRIDAGEKEKFVPLQRWQNVSKEANYTMQLNYHTSGQLRCMNMIKLQLQAAGQGGGGGGGGGGGIKRKSPNKDSNGDTTTVLHVSKKTHRAIFIDLSADEQEGGGEEIGGVLGGGEERFIHEGEDVQWMPPVEKIVPLVNLADDDDEDDEDEDDDDADFEFEVNGGKGGGGARTSSGATGGKALGDEEEEEEEEE